MTAPPTRVTRGHGLLEPLLARARAHRANRLIPDALRAGRILDIGCGSRPYFLSHTSFRDKVAIDQLHPAGDLGGIEWHTLDLNAEPRLPFAGEHFSVVTMLAVVEHLDPGAVENLFVEVHRVLVPSGRLIVTTPAPWTDGLLRLLARFGLVSREEIAEHVYSYPAALLGWYFARGNFDREKIRIGTFECGLNTWATADR